MNRPFRHAVLHSFMKLATAIARNKARVLFQPIAVAVGKNNSNINFTECGKSG